MSAINKLQVLVILIMTEIGCNSDDERSQNKWLVWPWTWDVQWLIESVPADMLFYHWLNVKDLSSSSSSSCTPPNLEWFLMLVRPTVLVPHVKGKYFDCHRQHLDSAASVTVWQCGASPALTVSHHTVTSYCHHMEYSGYYGDQLSSRQVTPQSSVQSCGNWIDGPASISSFGHWLAVTDLGLSW